MAKAQKNFLSGALILTVANIMVKIIGAVYKIPLANWIKPEGMNFYNDAYQIFSLLFILSTAGVPVAIAKMVSEAIVDRRHKEPNKILAASSGIFAIIGFILMVIMILSAGYLSDYFGYSTVNYCLYLIAPAIFLTSVTATIKGYFQGYKCMTPTAIYQVIEAAFKLVGLGIVLIMLGRGITDPMILACGGILGVTFGSFAAGVFLLIRYLTEKDLGHHIQDYTPSRSAKSIIGTTLSLAIPISLSSAVMSLTSTLDMFLVKGSLAAYGLSPEEVTAQYGSYAGATWSLFNLPPTLTVTVGIAVLPFLTSALAEHKKEEAFINMRSSAKVVALIAMPCALGMSTMAEPIIKLLYNESYWAVAIPTLRLLAISIFFVAFVSLTGVFLQAAGKVKTSLLTMGIGGVMKLIVNVVMVSRIGIMGSPLGTFACYGTIAALNVYFIYRFVGFRLPIRATVLKPLLCSTLCSGAAYGIWAGLHHLCRLSSNLSLIAGLAVAVVVYAVSLLLFKVLAKEDMAFIPKGAKIGAFLEKKGWIHE